MRQQLRRKRMLEWLILLAAWALIVLFSSTRELGPGSTEAWGHTLQTAAVQWFVWALAALLIVRLDNALHVSHHRLLLRLLLHIPGSLILPVFTSYLSVVLVSLITTGSLRWLNVLAVVRDSWSTGFYAHVVIYWAITGIYIAYTYHKRLADRELRDAQLEKLLADSNLNALKAQLQPHFLFNSLNTISANVERNPRAARRMLEQLGALLRLSLEYSESNQIRLEDELAFLKNYLALQEARYTDSLEVQWNIDSAAEQALVPTLILQPLVENAIVHGLSNSSRKGTIVVGVWKESERLHLSVEDNGVGLPADWDLEHSVGVGLNNTRERLRCLYGNSAQTLEVTSGMHGCGVRVSIAMPFNRAELAVF